MYKHSVRADIREWISESISFSVFCPKIGAPGMHDRETKVTGYAFHDTFRLSYNFYFQSNAGLSESDNWS